MLLLFTGLFAVTSFYNRRVKERNPGQNTIGLQQEREGENVLNYINNRQLKNGRESFF